MTRAGLRADLRDLQEKTAAAAGLDDRTRAAVLAHLQDAADALAEPPAEDQSRIAGALTRDADDDAGLTMGRVRRPRKHRP